MVTEPSIEDTVSILRGLKKNYETHHGVNITDGALVAAAQLSCTHLCNFSVLICLARYITNRFLPDKAIDLVDEACANTRVQLDSQPEALDDLEREKLRLEVEVTALKKEKDEASAERLEKAKAKLAKVDEEYKAMKSKYESERGSIDEVNKYVCVDVGGD